MLNFLQVQFHIQDQLAQIFHFWILFIDSCKIKFFLKMENKTIQDLEIRYESINFTTYVKNKIN